MQKLSIEAAGNQQQHEQEIENGLQTLDTQTTLESIKHTTNSSGTTGTVMFITQSWVLDYVMKGGSITFQKGIPAIVQTLDPKAGLDPATEIIRVVSSVLDIGIGIGGLVYKTMILNTAQKQIDELKEKKGVALDADKLKVDQLARLKQLEASIQYEKSQLSDQYAEQGIRTARNSFYTTSFVLSTMPTSSFILQLTAGVNAFITGASALLSGLLFIVPWKIFSKRSFN